jgi:hypothetical protein
MSNPQESKKLIIQAITSETTYELFEEIIILDDAGAGFNLTDADGGVASFTSGNITSLHIGGPGKPVNEVTITPAEGATINVLLYK